MRDPIWRHLGSLTVIWFLLMMALQLPHMPVHGGLALLAALFQAPLLMFGTMPMVAGIAAGTARLGERGVRRAIAAMGAVMLVMVVLDVWLQPAATRGELAATQQYGASWRPATTPATLRPSDRIGELGVVARLLTGRLPGSGETAPTYPRNHPRAAAAEAIPRAALLLAPFILMGVVLGMAAWVRRRVMFRSPRDELIARWVMAWVVAPATAGLLFWATLGNSYGVLFRGEPLWQPLIAYVPFLVVAALGWRAAYRTPPPSAAADAATSAR